jgi:hypothetical protein
MKDLEYDSDGVDAREIDEGDKSEIGRGEEMRMYKKGARDI